MNKILTKALKITSFLLLLTAAEILLSVPALGFSETYGNTTENEITAGGNMLYGGPVDITLIKDGVQYDYTYFPVECSDFLLFAGITLSETDSINIPEDTVLYDDIMIDVEKIEYNEYTVEEAIPCDYERTEVDTIPKGCMNITREGINGSKKVTYLDKNVRGVTVSREIVSEEIVSSPINGAAEYGIGGTVTSKDGTVYNYSYKKLMEATAYTYMPGITTMTTSTGATLAKGIVAVDPNVISYHTKMFITSDLYEYGYGVAEDTGGAIIGNIIDLAFMSYNECIQFGRRNMWVYILE